MRSGAAWAAAATRSGRQCIPLLDRHALARDEGIYCCDAVEVRRRHFLRRDHDLELLFDEEHQFVDPGRVEDAAADQRILVPERGVVCREQEVLEQVALDLLPLEHVLLSLFSLACVTANAAASGHAAR